MRRLLIRPGAIGDFILSLPAMEALRTDYTEVWCAEHNVPLARFADSARSIVSAGLDRVGFLPAADVLKNLRSFDSVISWYGTNRPEFRELMKAADIPMQFLTALPNGAAPAVDFYNRQAVALGSTPPTRFPVLHCPPIPRTYAVVHPFASSSAKRAPMQLFRKIADTLTGHMPVYWTCGPEEDLQNAILPGAMRIDNLYDLACWLTGARVYVGNDSGITHLAAAVGTPTLALFQSTDPCVWAPPAAYWTRLEMPRSS